MHKTHIEPELIIASEAVNELIVNNPSDGGQSIIIKS